ncbi:MAG: hypothetical protein KGJ09_09280 [Candidatus Omnitrophica bacterium]|nr:hypothetical protein [Candidatus Omnitrophota bacterium]
MRQADETTRKIGTILDEFAKKDAIHIAVAPVVAGEELQPGDKIVLTQEGKAVKCTVISALGLADPFIAREKIKKDERFYLFLYPGTITDLRHEWYHPAFPEKLNQEIDAQNRESAQLWIRHWAENIGLSYDEAMEAAHAYVDFDEFLCEGGRWEGYSVPEEFWSHFKTLTGKEPTYMGSFFSCSC